MLAFALSAVLMSMSMEQPAVGTPAKVVWKYKTGG